MYRPLAWNELSFMFILFCLITSVWHHCVTLAEEGQVWFPEEHQATGVGDHPWRWNA